MITEGFSIIIIMVASAMNSLVGRLLASVQLDDVKIIDANFHLAHSLVYCLLFQYFSLALLFVC